MYDLKEGHIKFVKACDLLASYAAGQPLAVEPEFVYLGTLLECDAYERLRYVDFNSDADFVEIEVTLIGEPRHAVDFISWYQDQVILVDEPGYKFLKKYCMGQDLKAMQFTEIKGNKS